MTEKITELKIGIRCQDIQTCLQDFSMGALGIEIKNITLLGKAERLAIHIRGVDIIDNQEKLEYIACQFGIEPESLPRVLEVLGEIGWTRIKEKEDKTIIVEESIPYFKDIYSEIGKYYKSLKHHEIEDSIIEVVDALALSPLREEDIINKIGINKKIYSTIMDIGNSSNIINKFKSDEDQENILYSPIYWTENHDKIKIIYDLLKKYGSDKIINVLKKVQDYQGYPLTDTILKTSKDKLSEDDLIIIDLIEKGILLTPKVDSFSGEKHFAFIPNVGIPIEEKTILEKAMAILACVRYGENFGSITKIKFPEVILERLLEQPHIIGPHSEIKKQYAILIGRGIGRIYPDRFYSDRWYFQLIDKEENIKAVNLAKDLLTVGEAIYGKAFNEKLREILFYKGTYEEAIRTLPKLKKSPRISKDTYEHILNKVIDDIRGASFD